MQAIKFEFWYGAIKTWVFFVDLTLHLPEIMEYQYIKSFSSQGVAHIQLNRPNKLNAICFQMVEELNHAISAIEVNAVNALFVYGSEKAFSAGGDLKEMKLLTQEEAERRSHFIHDTFRLLQTVEVPTLAFISGVCLGGGLELALHCDVRIATETAKLGLPELQYGIIPGAGGTVKLPIQIGYSQAAYYLLTGENIPTDLALQQGLVQRLIPEGTLDATISSMESYFGKLNSQAVKATKKMLQLNHTADVNTRYAHEAALFGKLLVSSGKEGIGERF
ncbi:MAG: enoyl-CoA hydratase/isomerase family protein [Salinivirgaceae bacterium]